MKLYMGAAGESRKDESLLFLSNDHRLDRFPDIAVDVVQP
jgi:hypothetical protein